MAYDKIYYFDKITYRRYELGEIQTNFNLNIVIDGDKDSMQIDVHSYSRDALQPNTIIYHANDPLQWFVVKKDNVKRNANEKGFYYIHSITLNGAIDLLKNRDLTDCGFNANGYTIDEFFKKLLKLSNFEFDYEIDYGDNVDKNQKVTYIKSYENYTLLSAIRDFFNGYNCDVKLGFEVVQQGSIQTYVINKAIFKIIPRTGNIDLTPIDISEFNDIRESINFDKESYGTTVISNAQNVVSTLAKTYPQVGGVRVTGNTYDTNIDSAYIKLPSPVWKVNWVKAICPLRVSVCSRLADGTPASSGGVQYSDLFYLQDDEQFDSAFQNCIDKIINAGVHDYVVPLMLEHKEELREIAKNSTITFYNNPTYNPRVDYNGNYGTIVKEEQTPYIPFLDSQYVGDDAHQVSLMDKDSAELLKSTNLSLIWERGSDKITNVKSMMSVVCRNLYWYLSDLSKIGKYYIPLDSDYCLCVLYYQMTPPSGSYRIAWHSFDDIGGTVFQINYIPMNDLKVKQDNENNNNDIQLYNQNGKLNDSVALSKMVDSYSKEITNPTITRYGEYYNLNDIPQIGQIVMDGNTKYVINNISYNLYPCESDDEDEINYYAECEFTLAEFISTKSIMTSPNTNVRDYGIPQKYNIKRRQVYRDYYEIGFSRESLANIETPYARLNNYLYFETPYYKRDYDHTALIKIDYDSQIGNPLSDTWYYQLGSTTYVMNKSVYEIIDFDDNNIIGYDIANSTTGFNMSDLWSSQYRAVTTPVSYVDDNGKFVGITLQMVNKDNLEKAYSQIDTQGNAVMFSAHCFIKDTLYDIVANPPHTPHTSETYSEEREYVRRIGETNYVHIYEINASSIGIEDIDYVEESSLSLDNVVVIANGNTLSASDYTLEITGMENGVISVRISIPYSVLVDATGTISVEFNINYTTYIPISDYVIDEQDYNKDPIEVPVFEYSLQLGDTKDVEVGDNILLNKECLMCPLNFNISNSQLTPLNATKYELGLVATGGTLDPDTQKRTYSVEVGNYPIITLENNNAKMRIKFYSQKASWFVESNEDDTIQTYIGEQVPITPSTQQIDKSVFIGKDIVIYKNSIRKIKYRMGLYKDLDYDRDVMLIIHKPTASQFEGNDLVLDLNYYKLN